MVDMKKKDPDALANKLSLRNPEPVVIDMGQVTTSTGKISVNPWDGFVADVTVRVNQPSVAGVFNLIDNEGAVLDTLSISNNGTLKVFIQEPKKVTTLFVQSVTPGTTFKVKTFILRHRITGVS
jgi:hypothetical protein